MTHRERVVENVKNISSLTDEAILKINPDVMNLSARKMMSIVGNVMFHKYYLLQNDPVVYSEIEDEDWKWESGSNDEKMLKDMELAESYCILFYLSIALKKVDVDTFMTQAEQWGEGSIKPIDIKKISEYSEVYLNEAIRLASIYTDGDSSGDITSVGTIGFATV